MKVVTLSGSMKYADNMMKIAWDLEANKGFTVIAPIYNVEGVDIDETMHTNLELGHLKKIEMCDCLYVVNIGGYIGLSTRHEIEYATLLNKEIIYHEKI